MIELIQTVLLAILVDRSLFIRSRYKISFENYPATRYNQGYFQVWILHKRGQDEFYQRCGGRCLLYFKHSKQKPRVN
jgi:hypothetical protein